MKLKNDHRHSETACPFCGAKLDCSTGVGHGDAPGPGNISICIECCGVSVFGTDMQLRKPTEAEQKQIEADPIIRHATKRWHEIVGGGGRA